jgi:predicted amidohydrolase
LCASVGFAVGFAAGADADRAAVVVTATNETHASNRFTAILNYAAWGTGEGVAVDWSDLFVSARPRSVALLQLRAHDRGEFPKRWPEIRARVAAAANTGAELIVLPEGTIPAYVIGSERVDPQLLESAARDLIAVAAGSGATIVYGGGRYEDERYFNAALVVTSAGVVGSADKCFLWHFDRRWFSPGNVLEPVDTPAGRLGVMICADGRIPTIASTLVERGAEILVVPTAWVSSGRDPVVLENLQADLFVNVRAYENAVPLIAANKVGVEARSVAYCGKSAIVAADGSFVARADAASETTLYGSVAVGPPFMARGATSATIERGHDPRDLPALLRVAIAVRHEDALHALATTADAELVIDPHADPVSHEVGLVQDEAMLDPRALVGPRLAGVRMFVWNASIAARWVLPLARTRAAELRAYVVVLDTLDRRALAIDPDGTLVCATFAGFELAAFTFERARTDAWRIAPHTDVREALERVEAIARRGAAR